MFEEFKGAIRGNAYDLKDMLRKIDQYYIEGSLSEPERDELREMARTNAAAALEYDVKAEIQALWAAVRELQRQLAAQEQGGSENPEEAENPEAWPEFVQPTGVHDAYSAGDRVTYGGAHYVCLLDNCAWAPDVYPDAWRAEA